jgi:hypothetical protein
MLPVNRHRTGTISHRKLATGSGAVLIALLFAGACSQPATGEDPPSTGGSSGGNNTGGKPSGGGTGGSSGGSTGGSAGSTSSGGSAGGGSNSGGTGGSSTPSGSGGSGASSGGSTGSSGGSSGTPDASDGTGGAGGGEPMAAGTLPTCTTDPAASPPALKKTLVAKIPAGDEAGQVVGIPGEKGFYIIGHTSGKLYYALDGKVDPTPMAAVPSKSNPPQSEQGFLGMALHPKFATNKLFYLLYTAPNITIDEYERTGPTSSKKVRNIWDKARAGGGAFHNGGQIWFNPKDGDKALLYHSVGNNSNIGQSGMAEGVAGRVLVHDVGGATVTSTTLSFGLRNPYRMTIDRGTGDMYIGEIDDPKGGAIFFSKAGAYTKDFGYRGGGIKAGVTGKEGDSATIGGLVYRGTKIPGLCGRYLFAGWPGGAIKSIVMKDGSLMGAAASHAGLGLGKISSFGEDGEGELYFSTQGSEVWKIEAM